MSSKRICYIIIIKHLIVSHDFSFTCLEFFLPNNNSISTVLCTVIYPSILIYEICLLYKNQRLFDQVWNSLRKCDGIAKIVNLGKSVKWHMRKLESLPRLRGSLGSASNFRFWYNQHYNQLFRQGWASVGLTYENKGDSKQHA